MRTITRLKNNKGFTLAEVLVTLAIIGVIAAAVIPTVNKAVPDKNKIMFRKAYSTLERTVASLINDAYLYPSNQTYQIDTTGIYNSAGFNYTTDDLGSAGTYNKFCYYLSQKLDLIGGNQTCPAKAKSGLFNFGTSTDGIMWYIYNTSATDATNFTTSQTSYNTKIIIDVNGINKTPNCNRDTNCSIYNKLSAWTCSTTCKDPDVFIIGVRFDGKLQIGSDVSKDTNAETVLKTPFDNAK